MRRNMAIAPIVALLVFGSSEAYGQDRKWTVDLTGGYTGMVDNETLRFLTLGGSARRYVTPRVSVGPELILMIKAAFCSAASPGTSGDCDGTRDRNVMLTANIVFDVLPSNGPGVRRLIPFLVSGAGIMWKRDEVGDRRMWSSDPAFSVGGGLRARVSETISATAEYRLGWELHHRLTGSVGVRW